MDARRRSVFVVDADAQVVHLAAALRQGEVSRQGVLHCERAAICLAAIEAVAVCHRIFRVVEFIGKLIVVIVVRAVYIRRHAVAFEARAVQQVFIGVRISLNGLAQHNGVERHACFAVLNEQRGIGGHFCAGRIFLLRLNRLALCRLGHDIAVCTRRHHVRESGVSRGITCRIGVYRKVEGLFVKEGGSVVGYCITISRISNRVNIPVYIKTPRAVIAKARKCRNLICVFL